MGEYIVSARKYRPMTFDSVVGQAALTATLKNAVKSGKLAHAYLFCGPRGVGKTTCARIFAKAINCMNPTADGEACGECESCKAFAEGRSYNIFELDAASNNSVEHIKSLMEQTRIPPQVEYASKLASLLPGGLESVYFVNSGAEAVEGALKLAKRFTGRTELISMRRAYHGSTHGSMSMMGAPEGEEWKGAFRPLLPDVQAIEFNDFDALNRITRRTACVLAEPVQGEAGVRTPAPGYLEALRRRCDEVGALLVFDEIQTGMGRTGQLFAMLKYGVTPDIVCLAKAFGGGMPLGAFVARREIMDTLQTDPVLGHITTFGGHPVCCAAGLAALNYLLDNKVVEQAEAKGALYETLLGSHPAVREIRRSGLLMAVELGESAKLYRTMELFKDAGILSDWFLFCDTAFRISPPLTISGEEVRESAALIRECLDRLR